MTIVEVDAHWRYPFQYASPALRPGQHTALASTPPSPAHHLHQHTALASTPSTPALHSSAHRPGQHAIHTSNALISTSPSAEPCGDAHACHMDASSPAVSDPHVTCHSHGPAQPTHSHGPQATHRRGQK